MSESPIHHGVTSVPCVCLTLTSVVECAQHDPRCPCLFTGVVVNPNTLIVQLGVSVSRSKGCNVITLVTGLIQIRSFTILLFALIIMLCDTCFRFLEETITFQFILTKFSTERQYQTEFLHTLPIHGHLTMDEYLVPVRLGVDRVSPVLLVLAPVSSPADFR